MKNDRKIVFSLFIVELVLLAVLTSIATVRSNSFAGESEHAAVGERIDSVSAFKNNFFPGSLYLNYYMSDYENNIPSEPMELYNYYTFSFSEEGVMAELHKDNKGLTSGFSSSTLPDSQLTIKECGATSSNPSTLSIGNLTIINPYLHNNLPLREVLAEPLALKKLTNCSDTSVVMYHTHTEEGYCLDESDQRNKSWDGSTQDNTRNVVALAENMCDILKACDIQSLADTTRHQRGPTSDYDYAQSKKTLIRLLEENSQTELVLDIHRDAAGMTNGKYYGPTVSDDEGNQYAQVMFVVGLNYNSAGVPDDTYNPYWKENFKLALLMIAELEAQVPGIARGISIRRNAYNQDLANNTLLVEIGFNGNLITEAQATASLFATVLADVYS